MGVAGRLAQLLLGGVSFWLLGSLGLGKALLGAVLMAYLPEYFNGAEKKGGNHWEAFQYGEWWKVICGHNPTTIEVEKELDNNKQYIFCTFPHGACSVNHFHTMTNGSGFLTKVYSGPRRDLCASVLFFFPILREMMLYLGCVDASSTTAKHNLKLGRSLLILIGGEKEQLMTRPNEHKIYIRSRKGFVKLALEYGADIVPMYVFGENELYEVSSFLMGFRKWLQRSFHIGLPVAFGWKNTLLPLPKPLGIEIGAPIAVKKLQNADISNDDVDKLHELFMKEMSRLFDRTKHKYDVGTDVKLEIH